MENKYLSILAANATFTYWHYNEKNRTIFDVANVNWFGSAWTIMNVGDYILLNATDGAATLVVTKIEKNKVWTKVMSEVKY